MFVQLGLQLISDMSMRIYSEASIAESPLLGAHAFLKLMKCCKTRCKLFVPVAAINFVGAQLNLF
jgi:hypothetical protein